MKRKLWISKLSSKAQDCLNISMSVLYNDALEAEAGDQPNSFRVRLRPGVRLELSTFEKIHRHAHDIEVFVHSILVHVDPDVDIREAKSDAQTRRLNKHLGVGELTDHDISIPKESRLDLDKVSRAMVMILDADKTYESVTEKGFHMYAPIETMVLVSDLIQVSPSSHQQFD